MTASTELATSPAPGPADADSIYTAFFSAVGAKPNESYEKLLTLLPSAKPDPDGLPNPRQLAGAGGGSVATDPLLAPAPAVHPLTKEWLDAASAMDEDVPLEAGDWLDEHAEPKEVLDEEGIPVVSGISRSSSCCILDAPGAVQVDNFTVEDEAEELPGSSAAPEAYVPSALERQAPPRGPSTHKPVLLLAPEAYSATARSAAAAAAQAAADHASSSPGLGLGLAPGPVVMLEDEIKRLGLGRPRQRPAAAAPPAPAAPAPAPARRQEDPGSSDDDEEVVEILNPGLVQARGEFEDGGLPDVLRVPGGVLDQDLPGTNGSGADAADTPALPTPAGVVASLPGECLASDSGAEAQLMEVNDQAMLEHMGLGAPGEGEPDPEQEDESLPRAGLCQSQAEDGDATKAAAGPIGGGDSAPSGVDADTADVSYVDVEGFRLDPDFDYDNVKLTPRGFPYNVLKPARQAPFAKFAKNAT